MKKIFFQNIKILPPDDSPLHFRQKSKAKHQYQCIIIVVVVFRFSFCSIFFFFSQVSTYYISFLFRIAFVSVHCALHSVQCACAVVHFTNVSVNSTYIWLHIINGMVFFSFWKKKKRNKYSRMHFLSLRIMYFYKCIFSCKTSLLKRIEKMWILLCLFNTEWIFLSLNKTIIKYV